MFFYLCVVCLVLLIGLVDGFVPLLKKTRFVSTQLRSSLPGSTVGSSTVQSDQGKMSSRKDERTMEELQELIREVGEVIASTNIRTGLERSIQVSQALQQLTLELVLKRDQYIITNTSDNEDSENKNISPFGEINVPKVIRRLFELLGSTYIKLGQFIASSPSLFPAEYVREFQSCLDNTPTIPYQEIKAIIETELKLPLKSVFDYVDPKPLASASIAQVHKARLAGAQQDVVIKVRKPSVEVTLKADLLFLTIATKVLEFIQPSLRRLSLADIVGDIRSTMLDELDFEKEAQSMENFRDFLKRNHIQDAVAPISYPEASTKKILTMDYLKGVPLADLDGIKGIIGSSNSNSNTNTASASSVSSVSSEKIMYTALNTWYQSVIENDIFHADLHAGNLLVLDDGRIGFIDFGIVGKLSPKVWGALEELTGAFSIKTDLAGLSGNENENEKEKAAGKSGMTSMTSFIDFRKAAKALVQMGATDDKIEVDAEQFGAELEAVFTQIMAIQPQIEITAVTGAANVVEDVQTRIRVDETETTNLVLKVVEVAEKNGLRLPREFGLLMKQVLYFDRYQKILAPDFDPMASIQAVDGSGGSSRGSIDGSGPFAVIDTTAVDLDLD